MLPDSERPETTKDREGFFHLCSISGDVNETVMKYIIRDHDKEKFEEKKTRLKNICKLISSKHPGADIDADISDTYYNMIDKIAPDHMYIVDNCKRAMKACGIDPIDVPVRGGTDGAMLSYKGLMCPNICAGGHNFHGIYEYISAESMERIAELLVETVRDAVPYGDS